MKKRSVTVLIVLFLLLIGAGAYVYAHRFSPTPETGSTPPTVVDAGGGAPGGETEPKGAPFSRTTVATGLDTPWTIAFLPTGEMLVTERKGALRVFGDQPRSISVPGVIESGESGLTGMALHPEFSKNAYVYLYFTTKSDGVEVNRVVRYRFDGASLQDETVIIDNIPAGGNHNGGQIAFGPDGKLYVCTGDAERSGLAQDKNSLAGKILRVNEDGSVPSDNPFGSLVYSYGHRNPQGITWDDQGRMWATEHGRSGVSSGYDEVNLIERGQNYGWPIIQGPATNGGMRSPVAQSGRTTTWAPAGMVYRSGTLYYAGLRGQALYALPIDASGSPGTIRALFKEEYGRLRAVALGPDGAIYFSTSNRDGRGDAKAGDDRIVRWGP